MYLFKNKRLKQHGERIIKFAEYFEPPRATHQSSQIIRKTKIGYGIGQSNKGKAVATLLFSKFYPHRPSRPLTKPTRAKIIYAFPFPKAVKSKYKIIEKKLPGNDVNLNPHNIEIVEPYDKRPDSDNLAKLVLDQLEKAGFFKDDKIIFNLNFMKVYSLNPGIEIELTELDFI